MRNIFFLSSFLGLLLTSCSPTLTPFTQKLYEENKWTNDELKQIQFYISDDIVLRRKAENGQTFGKIKMPNEPERTIAPFNTPKGEA